MKFNELGLSEKVLKAVEASGYDTPTPIQAQAIPHALQGRDILGIAQTGTGKTAAFTLPMLSMLEKGRARARMPRTLILEPTRELAAQVEEAFNRYGVNHKLNVALLIGGVSFGDQETKITRGADVLIATPGRLLDFTERATDIARRYAEEAWPRWPSRPSRPPATRGATDSSGVGLLDRSQVRKRALVVRLEFQRSSKGSLGAGQIALVHQPIQTHVEMVGDVFGRELRDSFRGALQGRHTCAESSQHAFQRRRYRVDVSRGDHLPDSVLPDEVRQRPRWREDQARLAEAHDLEDLRRVDAFGTRQRVEDAHRGVTPRELLNGTVVVDVPVLSMLTASVSWKNRDSDSTTRPTNRSVKCRASSGERSCKSRTAAINQRAVVSGKTVPT